MSIVALALPLASESRCWAAAGAQDLHGWHPRRSCTASRAKSTPNPSRAGRQSLPKGPSTAFQLHLVAFAAPYHITTSWPFHLARSLTTSRCPSFATVACRDTRPPSHSWELPMMQPVGSPDSLPQPPTPIHLYVVGIVRDLDPA